MNSPHFPDTRHSPNKFIHIPPLLRDLPGDLICPYGIVIRLFAESKVVAQVDQGQGDAKPHAEQGHHGRERHLQSHREAQGEASPAPQPEVAGQTNSPSPTALTSTSKPGPSGPVTPSPPAGSRGKGAPTAPEECFPQMKQFRTKQIPKTTPGYRVAVCKSNHR